MKNRLYIVDWAWDEAIEHIKTDPTDDKSLLTDAIVTKVRGFLSDRRELLQPPEDRPLSGILQPHRVTLKDNAVPQYEPARRMGPAELTELQKQLQYMLSVNYIRPSQSSWGAPVMFTPKPGGKLRLVTDFRRLNRQCQEMRGGLPLEI